MGNEKWEMRNAMRFVSWMKVKTYRTGNFFFIRLRSSAAQSHFCFLISRLGDPRETPACALRERDKVRRAYDLCRHVRRVEANQLCRG